MYQRVLLNFFVVATLMVVSGCGKIVEKFNYGEMVTSPIPGACSDNIDCRLTDELYAPCGSVYSIHVNTPQSTIDAYNDAQMSLNEGIDYDCDVPPSIHEYLSMCREHVCVSAKIQ